MRYICDICEEIFKRDDRIIHIRPGVVTDPNGAYLGTSELLDDANTIHEKCLRQFVMDEPEIQVCQQATPVLAPQRKNNDRRQVNAEEAISVLKEQMGETDVNAKQIIMDILEKSSEIINTEHFIREYFVRKQVVCSL